MSEFDFVVAMYVPKVQSCLHTNLYFKSLNCQTVQLQSQVAAYIAASQPSL